MAVLTAIGASVWGTSRALQDPGTSPPVASEADAARAQQKLFRAVTGAKEPVVITEAELNAFVRRNVDARDWPFEESVLYLRDDNVVDVAGRVPVRRLVAESPVPLLGDLLPSAWLRRSVWLQLRTHASVERSPRAQLRLDVREMVIGRQRVPTIALRLLFDPASLRFVRVSLPDTIADVRIEAGRAVVRPASPRGRG